MDRDWFGHLLSILYSILSHNLWHYVTGLRGSCLFNNEVDNSHDTRLFVVDSPEGPWRGRRFLVELVPERGKPPSDVGLWLVTPSYFPVVELDWVLLRFLGKVEVSNGTSTAFDNTDLESNGRGRRVRRKQKEGRRLQLRFPQGIIFETGDLRSPY